MKSSEIRQSFLNFFESKGHRIVDSSSLLPETPNLLFTNAGMNPFVPYFLGERCPQYKRIADTQKCIRAGGKHNDLEEVGFDTYHHTFFEMFGNWSLGDYFKEEAILWAWELLTQIWHFPKKRLYATVYRPEVGEPASFDEEAYVLWEKIFLAEGMDPSVHILMGSKKDNFWMMGDTGPCGPCSEIHMDLTPKGDTQGRWVNQGDARCIEIWNLVFMQYNALPNGTFELIKNKFVDTGMGFERVAGIFSTTQNFKDFSQAPSNYDSDLFTPLLHQLEQWSGHKYGGRIAANSQNTVDADTLRDCAFRTVADHVRTLTFAIADGILPGNEGRHYVLRRIIRRAILFGQKLNLPNGFLADLSRIVVQHMHTFFKELIQQSETVRTVLNNEEQAFKMTLQKGLHLFEKWSYDDACLSGDQAFLLYDTYGFPLDLTQLMAKEKGIAVDVAQFNIRMQEQKGRSKAALKKTTIAVQENDSLKTHFVGYDISNCTAYESLINDCVQEDTNVSYIITASTPFYAEKGGQVGDSGQIIFQDGTVGEVVNTRYQNQIILHQVALPYATIIKYKNTPVILSVDIERRKHISNHHTATHILHWALRKILGEHVKQAGSWVQADQLRFDFSHFEKLSETTIADVERLCCEKILENLPISTLEVPFDQRPEDCLAFFGDRYGDTVRVVQILNCSKELCGGTHATRTGDLGILKIKQESAVAAGVRRIEATVGIHAMQHINTYITCVRQLEKMMDCPLQKLHERFQLLQQQKTEVEKRYQQVLQKTSSQLVAETVTYNTLCCVRFVLQSVDTHTLKNLSKQYFNEQKPDILCSFGEQAQKGVAFVFCSEEAIQKGFTAAALIQRLLQPLGANGGGKADFASGGVKRSVDLRQYLQIFSLEKFFNESKF
ncbi:MAG: alanine--tRNA ligase [Puniceicoccales bacterium]|jgi:alanyl-tRNA synthetase|nr:alanine--tRNA ligase [Puniceicoccales bacterium]